MGSGAGGGGADCRIRRWGIVHIPAGDSEKTDDWPVSRLHRLFPVSVHFISFLSFPAVHFYNRLVICAAPVGLLSQRNLYKDNFKECLKNKML